MSEPERPRSLRRRAGAAIGASVVATVIVISVDPTGSDHDADPAPPTQPSSPTAPDSGSDLGGEAPVVAAFGRWPDPPRDHEPHLVSRPGRGPLVSDPAPAAAVLYVNSIGRPTLIDLASGDRVETDIADDRRYERIAIEGAEFRSLVERKNVPLAGPDAIVVHVYRSREALPAVGSAMPGIHLCLADGCGARLPGIVDARDARLLDADAGADAEIVALLFGEHERVGRFVAIGDTIELPAPSQGPVWLIEPTT